MDRRRYLQTLTGIAAALGLAGCSGAPGSGEADDTDDTDDDETTGDDEPTIENTPEEAVEQYYTALSTGDRDAGEEVLHSENSEMDELGEATDEQLEATAEQTDIEVDEIETVDEDSETAIVDIQYSVTSAQEAGTGVNALELAIEDNRWKIKGETTIDRGGEITDSIPDDPEAVARQYFEALDVDDTDRMQELIHTESPEYPVEGIAYTQVSPFDVTIEETTLREESDTEAEVEVIAEFTSQGQSNIETNEVLLQREDDEWRIWGSGTEDANEPTTEEITDPVPEEPTEIVEQYYQAFDIGDRDRVQELEHDESPGGLTDEFPDESFAALDIAVEETSLLSDDEDEAVVEATITFLEETTTTEIELRTQGGEWRIWAEEAGG